MNLSANIDNKGKCLKHQKMGFRNTKHDTKTIVAFVDAKKIMKEYGDMER